MSKKALLLLAAGAEEMEAVITIDVLRRAGVAVTVAGLHGPEPVKCSRGVTLVPDEALEAAAKGGPYDAVVLPGGLEGARSLCKSDLVKTVLKEQEAAGRLIAAICAAPTALKAHGVCTGRALTSYPNFKEELLEGGQYIYVEDRVAIDGNLVTSRGPGTALEFALALVGQLCGPEQQAKTGAPLLLPA
ncbi:Parkinson disease protein 7 homolog [Pollicipes pollicipes]|uniref:Parkinson disease protein 7 homolog n=1 Tax=Pollicipes pollicipes TaxID=41117 RepID=UPI001884DB42|nr:Parkinson disease protein 7 homolog [Pollicipes pollicipes]XP_037092722.1 Parkinson disease protein 7 homolog [Pollicipes pollicipes]